MTILVVRTLGNIASRKFLLTKLEYRKSKGDSEFHKHKATI
jgi:hypothetical protein